MFKYCAVTLLFGGNYRVLEECCPPGGSPSEQAAVRFKPSMLAANC